MQPLQLCSLFSLSHLAKIMLKVNKLLLFFLALFLYMFPVLCGCCYCCLQAVNTIIKVIFNIMSRQFLIVVQYRNHKNNVKTENRLRLLILIKLKFNAINITKTLGSSDFDSRYNVSSLMNDIFSHL